MTANEKRQLIDRVSALPVVEQLELIEELVRSLRRAQADHGAAGRDLDAMVADAGMQRVLRNEDVVTHDKH